MIISNALSTTPVVILYITIGVCLSSQACATCWSNETHIGWPLEPPSSPHLSTIESSRNLDSKGKCHYEMYDDAKADAVNFLRQNVMSFDRLKLETLGFGSDTDGDIDGLSGGVVGPTVELAMLCKMNYSWTNELPKSIFYEYVLNYANTNEARTNWRPLLGEFVQPVLKQYRPKGVGDIVKALNTHIWTMLAPKNKDSIVFVSGQTPLIYDPMSVIAFGYASCTGLAILFVNALRTAGVAARIVGTPAWMGDRNQGNHNWVEVYYKGSWYFMEPSPKQPIIDTLERNPCERWFCQKDRFGVGRTRVYAARLDQQRADTHYPLAWEWNSTDVPGVDRTEYYEIVCSQC